MGRKIPARKHRGVKDPLLQLARREAGLNLNVPPKDPKQQEIPNSVLHIRKLCEQVKEGHFNQKTKRKRSKVLDSQKLFLYDPKLPGMKMSDKPLPRLIQEDGESDDSFFNRFSKMAQEIYNEATMEDKFDVKVQRSSEGTVTAVEKDFTDVSLDESNTKRKKNAKSKLKPPPRIQPLGKASSTSSEVPKRRPNLKERRKERRKTEGFSDDEPETVMDFSLLKDEVKFGEVAHMPPRLSTKPKGAVINNRPGTKTLLLKEYLPASKSRAPAFKTAVGESDRLKAVAAYRALKAQRSKSLK